MMCMLASIIKAGDSDKLVLFVTYKIKINLELHSGQQMDIKEGNRNNTIIATSLSNIAILWWYTDGHNK
jgi:hypothetical protein